MGFKSPTPKMVNTILFDLDGTLLQFRQDEFIKAYFGKLAGVFVQCGIDPEQAIKAVWAGTRAMIKNDGKELNIKRFWNTFAEALRIDEELLLKVEAACDEFYTNDFNEVKSIVKHSDIPKQIVKKMKDKGYTIVLATNPLFPECGVLSRLEWGEIDADDFALITHYGNSSYCKPNLDYFHEILSKVKKTPEECLMVGNTPHEDMIAGKLGMQTFLVMDSLEYEGDSNVTDYRRGSLKDLESFLLSMPDLV